MLAAGATLALTAACSSAAPAPYGQVATPTPTTPRVTYHQAPDARVVGTPKAAPPDACAKNTKQKAVIVRLSQQHMWLCEKSKIVRDSAITSGMKGQYTETPTGRFEIQSRTRNTSLTLKSGKTYAVKYWIPFDAPLFGFHDSSWQDFAYGSAKYKTEGSHGCVHLPVKSIRFLYKWADIGTSVRIKQ